jgi:hypothetical protein
VKEQEHLDRLLADAASAIAAMPEAEFAVGLQELEEAYRRRHRDDLARARYAAFLDSLELERAAYELAERHDREGGLEEAARWYRVAARNDHADAALRLGRTLDLLAGRCAERASGDSYSAQREEFHLVTEAAQAYAEAYAAGHVEAADLIDEMLAAFTRRQRVPVRPADGAEPADGCTYVRDFTPATGVLREEEIQELSRHAAQCLPCLAEFVLLVKAAAAATPVGNVADPFAAVE